MFLHCCSLLIVTRILELYKEFQEEAYSVALHPTGLFILVGFSDKLRLMNLVIDDIRTFKEFTVRGCREVGYVCVPMACSLNKFDLLIVQLHDALFISDNLFHLSVLSATVVTCLQLSMEM